MDSQEVVGEPEIGAGIGKGGGESSSDESSAPPRPRARLRRRGSTGELSRPRRRISVVVKPVIGCGMESSSDESSMPPPRPRTSSDFLPMV